MTVIWYLSALYYMCLKVHVVKPLLTLVRQLIKAGIGDSVFFHKYCSILVWGLLIAAAIVYCIIITAGNRYRLVSGIGLLAFVLFGYLMSEHKRSINWNQVLWGLAMQFSLALLVLRTTFGKQLFNTIGDKVTAFLSFTDKGTEFLFGYLVTGVLKGVGPEKQGSVFAFKVSFPLRLSFEPLSL